MLGNTWIAAHSLVCAFIYYDDLCVMHNRRVQTPLLEKEYKYVTMHLCHNRDCLNPHHLAHGLHEHNMNMLHLPLLPGYEATEQLDISSPEYYWLTLEAMKEKLIGELGAEGKLKRTGLISRARQQCLTRAQEIVEAHLLKCSSRRISS
jgi:hypothetical protein